MELERSNPPTASAKLYIPKDVVVVGNFFGKIIIVFCFWLISRARYQRAL